MQAAQGGSDVDRILAQGLDKLDTLGQFMSLYQDWTGKYPNETSPSTLIDSYQQQQGMSVEALRTYATALGNELTATLNDLAVDQQSQVTQLDSVWNESTGSSAAAQAQSQLGVGLSADTESLSLTANTVTVAADTLERMVSQKASAIEQSLSDNVAGLSFQQVSQLVEYAKNGFGGSTSEEAAAKLRAILPEYPGGGSDVA
ncbi:hypothetical protein QX204_01230 [Nocardia sp. PE-7]|uniref:hypothetical protein n=1 Tax=Nocardia sp. PE-7 TaxID=3058426 RepID=UPI00265830C0|nr:hypothetical protein [Nocardia sp. PE-7]WKG10160.1 hypothetical protein QX204_01230 [Nocardia sp. PE-7]